MDVIAGWLQIQKDAFGGFPKASLFEEGNKWIQKVKQGAGGYHLFYLDLFCSARLRPMP
jgi:hypothetical protein